MFAKTHCSGHFLRAFIISSPSNINRGSDSKNKPYSLKTFGLELKQNSDVMLDIFGIFGLFLNLLYFMDTSANLTHFSTAFYLRIL